MPSSFCLPPVEYSPGTIPVQADRFRPFFKGAAVVNRSDQGCCGDRADSWNLRESLASAPNAFSVVAPLRQWLRHPGSPCNFGAESFQLSDSLHATSAHSTSSVPNPPSKLT